MIYIAGPALAFFILWVRATLNLRADVRDLKRQLSAAREWLKTAENYSTHLEKEHFEIRKLVNAKVGERTTTAVKNYVERRRVWS